MHRWQPQSRTNLFNLLLYGTYLRTRGSMLDRLHHLERRYLTQEAIEDPRIGPAFAATDDITLCLIPENWRSWRAKDIDEQFFGGLLASDPKKWFRPIEN